MNTSSPLRLKIKEAIRSHTDHSKDRIHADHSSPDRLKLKVEMNAVKQYSCERKLYAKLIYRFIYLWCVAVAVLLLGCGIGKIRLSDIVLTMIIGCTTLNVVGFFYLVTRYFLKKTNP